MKTTSVSQRRLSARRPARFPRQASPVKRDLIEEPLANVIAGLGVTASQSWWAQMSGIETCWDDCRAGRSTYDIDNIVYCSRKCNKPNALYSLYGTNDANAVKQRLARINQQYGGGNDYANLYW